MSNKKRNGRFAMLPRNTLLSEAVATLPHLPYRLLTVAAAEFNGGNNGDISLAPAVVEPYGIRRGQLSRAIKILLERGLLIRVRQGGLGCCSLYALPWLGLTDESRSLAKFDHPRPKLPDMGFMRWRAKIESSHPHDASPTSSGCFSAKIDAVNVAQRHHQDAVGRSAPTSSGCTSKNLPYGTAGDWTTTEAGEASR
jgi:hypothetical protein